ncbi:hypothetical protein N7517_010328 [Penicillium concentricum]|uniref:Uncharacterized protein n=1 Tax=Penicillium concentricum TaxID=293559 RepID=A0A9W9UT85_9EURO|nr:uncharacterized protein N7517_010328 [Penicillium concentricum]KAJ5355719.1 hypothetical protein N7517_010328 [Penicillium concentricum]
MAGIVSRQHGQRAVFEHTNIGQEGRCGWQVVFAVSTTQQDECASFLRTGSTRVLHLSKLVAGRGFVLNGCGYRILKTVFSNRGDLYRTVTPEASYKKVERHI